MLGLLLVPLPVLVWGVDMEVGREEGERYAREEEQRAREEGIDDE